MPSARANTQPLHTRLRAEVLLRSINPRYDADYPERIIHFHPTAKSVPFLKALAGEEAERAFFIVAPYGSGKSITATYLLHLIENRPESSSILEIIEQRLAQVSPELGQLAIQRRKQQKVSGFVFVLQGYYRSLAQGLKNAVIETMTRLKLDGQISAVHQMPCEDIEQAITLLLHCKNLAYKIGCDRLLILWDEFGRHIETLLAEGRSAVLMEIQTLAEFVNRSRDFPMTLGLLLHQGLLYYAGNMPQSVRAEWTKIEGRFQTIQYVDDSKELYHLIGEVISSQRVNLEYPSGTAISAAVTQCKQLGLFPDFAESELQVLLERAYPLEPVTLYLLPRLSARVAQNERTLFRFLYSMELTEPLGPEYLYDYFSPVMRSDTAVGGTYRQWLETQSALSKIGEDAQAAKVLKVACLLGLGISGERSRARRELLLFALRGYKSLHGIEAIVDQLIERKLLLYRKHNDEVSLWHGTDVDLRRKLEEEKHRQRRAFHLLPFLTKETPPPIWRPVEYNTEYHVRRYLVSEYHTPSTLQAYLSFELRLQNIPVGCDGKVLYIVAETYEEIQAAEEITRNHLRNEYEHAKPIVIVIPREPLSLFEVALEIWCLLQMHYDQDLIASDPLVVPEIQQMTDDARGHLQHLIDRLVQPNHHGPRWFCNGHALQVESSRDLRRKLSEIMRKVYSLTPKINNEMIVRHKPSSVIINARKKLLLGILERSGKEDLGIQGNFPDASMFRTVLLNTGLYYRDSGQHWKYAVPQDIQDPGLQAVWKKIQEFLTIPSKIPKDLRKFFDELMEPPIGLRAGLLPILFAAGIKAFPSAKVLRKKGTYVTDILPSEIEELCRNPELYQLIILDLDQAKRAYLQEFYHCFSPIPASEFQETDLIRRCFDALERWKAQLPPAAMTTKRLSDRARRFRSVIYQEGDPVHLLFEEIPTICGYTIDQREKLLEVLRGCKEELMGVTTIYREHASASVRRVLIFNQQGTDASIRQIVSHWAHCFPDSFMAHLLDSMAKGLLSRMRTPYDSDELLLESLSSLLVGKSLNRWDDSTVAIFDREIQETVHRVEETALAMQRSLPNKEAVIHGLSNLVQGRISQLFDRLVDLVGPEEAKARVSSLTDRTERNHHGNNPRSVR